MEKRIELEKRGRDPSKITELNLDNSRSTSIVGLTEEFSNLESLSLINVGLTSLKGFPKLPNLRKLELSDNRISNGLNLLHGSTKLTHLNLSGNKVKDIESLEPLKEFTSLQNLDLFNNDVTSVENYREKLFNLVPGLKFLDGFDREDREAEDSDDGEDEEDGNDVGDGESEGDDGDIGNDIDDEDDLDDEDDEEDDDVPLNYLANDEIEEESEDDDFDPENGPPEDDDVDEESDEEDEPNAPRGEKRKLDAGDDDA